MAALVRGGSGGMSVLRAVASALAGLPPCSSSSPAAACCTALAHGSGLWWRSGEAAAAVTAPPPSAALLPPSLAAAGSRRGLVAEAQPRHHDDEAAWSNAPGSSGAAGPGPGSTSAATAEAAAAAAGPSGGTGVVTAEAAAARRRAALAHRAGDRSTAESAEVAAAAEAAAAAAAAARLDDAPPPPEGGGDVSYPRGALVDHIAAHWAALQACPSGAEYTRRVSFDEFGARYVAQLEREEAARTRALAQLGRDIQAGAKAGQPYRTGGGVASRLVASWLPLLQAAIQEEQDAVLRPPPGKKASGGGGRRDRPNYGPYLLLLPAEDLAHVALQTVLSRVATSLPGKDEAWGGGGGALLLDAGGGRGGRGGGAEAGMVPAVLLADAVGRSANARLKYLRFRADQWALERRKRDLLRTLSSGGGNGDNTSVDRSSSSSSSSRSSSGQEQQQQDGGEGDAAGAAGEPGALTAASLARYGRHNSREAASFAQGQARLKALQELRQLGKQAARTAQRAREDVHWGAEVRIKVGAALLALLVENTHLPDGVAGRRAKAWSGGAAGGGSSGGGSRAAAAAASGGGGGGAPAFEYVYRSSLLKQQSYVRASAGLARALLADRDLAAALLTKVPPMLVPPLPWTGYARGGYLTSRHWMMRTRHSAAVMSELRRGAQRRAYDRVLDALNVLGNTAWRVNTPVYETLCALWDARSTAAGLPQQIPLRPPPPPGVGYRLLYEGGALVARAGQWSALERRTHVLAGDDVRRRNRNMASLKADFLLKKQVADEFAGAPELYYPHTVDFRGRAYPLHPSLNHLGDDVSRGLLCFARGVPLGPQGLDWLYVHLANVWGHGQDKLPYDGRRAFARGHLATVLDVAADPLANTWWQGAEKPWQALAACLEIAAALQSITPETFVSRLPVHMDGSCNGLQHYAALGRDEAGGRAVNLLPGDRPQDVYAGVAGIVARRVAADAAAGDARAARCAPLVDRKLVKQTVMTSVYGVTPVGARAQVENRLRERRVDMLRARAQQAQQARGGGGGGAALGRIILGDPLSAGPASAASAASMLAGSAASAAAALWPLDTALQMAGPGAAASLLPPLAHPLLASSSSQQPQHHHPTTQRDEHAWLDDPDALWAASKYLADHTLASIGEMFGAAREIMTWLAECARLVAAEDAPVRWTSPLGLPITQPYHKLSMQSVSTATQSFSVIAHYSGAEGKAGGGSGGDGRKGGGGGGAQWLKARQRSAFPPNFIHSVDSTHMMLTALACAEAGVTFAGVHDSFWAHAGNVPAMNALLREKFVELHTRTPDLLEDLLAQLQRQHPQVAFPPVPARGRLVVQRVRSSRYFFS